ncbi:hypothetical protein [Actinoplanes flavus]|nr:hypothetical protein [Actinoplanes flavus]
MIGGRKVRIRWERRGDGNVCGSGSHPTTVNVPSTGTKRLNLTIG